MINDRVVVGDKYYWKEEDNQSVMAYMPQQQDGKNIVTPDGSTVMLKAGGVKCGSTGTIKGDPVNVHRSYLHNLDEYTPATYSSDMIKMVPVFLDKYQRLGWFPIDNIRIFAGSV
jgi:hypothetical protein